MPVNYKAVTGNIQTVPTWIEFEPVFPVSCVRVRERERERERQRGKQKDGERDHLRERESKRER